MRIKLFIVFLCAAMISTSVYADEIYLKNGDRLTGKIESLVDGKLILKSDLAGTITIDFSNIKTLSSSDPIEVHLKDGTVLKEKVASAKDNYFAIEETKLLKAQEFEMVSITSINPPIPPKPKWEGDISAGYSATHGNTNTDSIIASINLRKRTENDRTQLSGDYVRTRQKDEITGDKEPIEDWWRIKGIYDYFLTKKFFVFGNGSYEKDSIAELDRRVILGGGAGYQWIESKNMNFATRGGLASLYEKYDNQTESNTELSAQVGYDFDAKLLENIKFIHNLTYYPSLEQFSDYFLTSNAEIRADISESMFTNFKIIFNYDASPAADTDKTDVKYIWGLGISF